MKTSKDLVTAILGTIQDNRLSFDLTNVNLDRLSNAYIVNDATDGIYMVVANDCVKPTEVVKENKAIEATEEVVSNAGFIRNIDKDKACYLPGHQVSISFDVVNTSEKDSPFEVLVDLFHINKKVTSWDASDNLYLRVSESKSFTITIPDKLLENNKGYIVSITAKDKNGHVDVKTTAFSVESDWTLYPRYGVVGGSGDFNNSILNENKDAYMGSLEVMKNMNINSYFFYDAYKSPQNPFPVDKEQFSQDWNTWSHSVVDVQMVKDLVDRMHKHGSVAMLYNMCFARSVDEPEYVPAYEYAYNYDTYGMNAKGTPYINYIDGKPFQYYYHPASNRWREKISSVMIEAMENGGFDGWQGDTIGDRTINAYYDADKEAHYMSDYYGDFIADMKLRMPNKFITINDVNGEHIDKMLNSNQDVVYNELWPAGTSALSIDGKSRQQTEYGDLKARVDEVRRKTGKSLIVGAYMEQPTTEWHEGKLIAVGDGASIDAIENETYNLPAVLLTTATIAAAGGYHMSSAALANSKDEGYGIGILEKDYYPTQSLRTTKEITDRISDYNQFITGYETILRGKGLEDDDTLVEVINEYGFKQNNDILGINGYQVWTWTKKAEGFRTIQMINLSDILSDWKNTKGKQVNKQPTYQHNLDVFYSVSSKAEANKLVNNVYITSPDNWSKSQMIKCKASVVEHTTGYALKIHVEELDIWNVIYIEEN